MAPDFILNLKDIILDAGSYVVRSDHSDGCQHALTITPIDKPESEITFYIGFGWKNLGENQYRQLIDWRGIIAAK